MTTKWKIVTPKWVCSDISYIFIKNDDYKVMFLLVLIHNDEHKPNLKI